MKEEKEFCPEYIQQPHKKHIKTIKRTGYYVLKKSSDI
jgi:hypothetical protein